LVAAAADMERSATLYQLLNASDKWHRYGAQVVEAPTEYREYARQMVREMSQSDPGVFLFDQVRACVMRHPLFPEFGQIAVSRYSRN
jgi:hypothetical protein